MRMPTVICGLWLGLLAFPGCNQSVGDRVSPAEEQPTHEAEPKRRMEFRSDEDDPRRVTVAVTSAQSAAASSSSENDIEELSRRFRLVLLTEDAEGGPTGQAPPILGKIRNEDGLLIFRPAFPLLAGRTYRASLKLPDSPNGGLTLTEDYTVPDRDRSEDPPELNAIYPSGDLLPANHLKFYLVFSEPMQRGEIFGHFRLDNLTRKEQVPRPFRHTELWSQDGRVLTLWFHPGRVKDGVNLNVEIGPILNEGDEYRLTISGDWLSQRGVSLGDAIAKEFRAGPKDRTQPDPSHWKLETPAADTREALRCLLGKPLDWALLQSEVRVFQKASGGNAKAVQVEGVVETDRGESVWQFTPTDPWREGEYYLSVGVVLEDLAGNSIEKPFEVDLSEVRERAVAKETERWKVVEFQIGNPDKK